MAEDQVSPSANQADADNQLGTSHQNHVSATRRIRPGSKANKMHSGPPLIPLGDIDSAFQLTEHLKAMHEEFTSPTPNTTLPIDRETAQLLASPPPGIDRGIWLYELCRFLTQKANAMVIGLFSDTPACSATTCPEMRASEWQYLCAAHEPPKSCCAIDYCCHTLDWCATSLTSTKLFPSRLSLGTEAATAQIQIRKMTEVFRRVYRIFAHAWFSHREAFWRVEAKTGLYIFFKTVCEEYRLIQEDNYTIPPEAEGVDETQQQKPLPDFVPTLMRRDTVKPSGALGDGHGEEGNTTKRHKHGLTSVSDRSASVATIIHEEVEEDEDDVKASPEHEVADEVVEVKDEKDQEDQEDQEEQEDPVTSEQEKEAETMDEHPPAGQQSEEKTEDTPSQEDQEEENVTVIEPELEDDAKDQPEEKADETSQDSTTDDVQESTEEAPSAQEGETDKAEPTEAIKAEEEEEEEKKEGKDEEGVSSTTEPAADADEASKTVAD